MSNNMFRARASCAALAAVLLVLSAAPLAAAPPAPRPAIPFLENRESGPEEIAFTARTFAGGFAVTRSGDLVYEFRARGGTGGVVLTESTGDGGEAVRGLDRSPVRVSDFRGGGRTGAGRAVPAWNTLDMGERWEGIRITLRAAAGNVEKRFHVGPGADPSAIRLRVEGAERLRVDEEGRLVCETAAGPVLFTAPAAFQEYGGLRMSIDVAYRTAEDGAYGFAVGPFDRSRELVIDPLLASTFLGGTSDEGDWSCNSLIEDGSGNLYAAARTLSSDFPSTPGAYDTVGGPSYDLFLVKLSGDMTTLLAATFLGGSGSEGPGRGDCLALDGEGNPVVAGVTFSSDFPVTPGAKDTTYANNGDVFVTKLGPDLDTLLASTYFGKRAYELANSVLIDDAGRIFIAGRTQSSALPTTPGCYDSTYDGTGPVGWGGDLFLARFDPDLTELQASTFLGSSGWEQGGYLAFDGNGDLVVTGSTGGSGFPATLGAHDRTYNGGQTAGGDAFVSILDGDLSTLVASTFLGGGANDFAHGVAVDGAGRIYVTGETGEAATSDFPTTPDAYDTSYNTWGGPGRNDVFLSRLAPDLSSLQASTFLGGGGLEIGLAVRIGGGGDVFVSGSTLSYDFPVTPCAYDPLYNGGSADYGGDLFLARLDADLTELRASTFLGGSGEEQSGRFILDGAGNPVVIGETRSANFPSAPGGWQENFSGGSGDDIVLARLDPALSEAGTAVNGGAPGAPLPPLTARPNPFNPRTTIAFTLERAERIELDVYDPSGRRAARLAEGIHGPGPVRIGWDGAGDDGAPLTSGVYLCRLRAESGERRTKVVLIR